MYPHNSISHLDLPVLHVRSQPYLFSCSCLLCSSRITPQLEAREVYHGAEAKETPAKALISSTEDDEVDVLVKEGTLRDQEGACHRLRLFEHVHRVYTVAESSERVADLLVARKRSRRVLCSSPAR
jgi:hypothetical protein